MKETEADTLLLGFSRVVTPLPAGAQKGRVTEELGLLSSSCEAFRGQHRGTDPW